MGPGKSSTCLAMCSCPDLSPRFERCLGLFADSVLVALRPVRRVRSITGIGGANHHGDHRRIATRDGGVRHESAVVSPRRSLIFSALTC
jgi:hypothetical protein